MFELAKNHGPIAFAILFVGLLSVVVGVLAVALSKGKAGMVAGFVGLSLVIVTGTASVVGVMTARMAAQRAADAADGAVRTEILQRGNLESLGLAKLGLGFGVVGLVTGVLGLARGLSARARPARSGSTPGNDAPASKRDATPRDVSDLMRPLESGAGLAGLVVGSLALFSVIGAGMPFLVKPPGTPGADVDPAKKIAEAEQLLGEGRFEEGCTALEQAFADSGDSKRSGVKNVDGMVSECFEQRLGRAFSGIEPAERDRILAALEATKLPLDEEQRLRLGDAVERAKAGR